MKGKLKFKINVVIIMIAILSASIVFALTKHNDKQTNMKGVSAAYAVQTIDGKQYSALLEQNVIFSVERVSIKDGTPEPDAVTFYGKAAQDGTLNPYVFYDINDNGKSKQVVADGSLVMLENSLVNEDYVNRFGGSDSIIVSLGQYVYNNVGGTPSVSNPVGKIETPMKDTVCSQLTYLKVDVTFNGEKIDPKTDNRYQLRDLLSVEGNAPYTDFLFLIKQDGVTNIEGHYQINFTYMKDGKECSGSFEFFVACKTSYEKIETINQQSYNSKPTLGWSEAYNFSEQEAVKGVVNYYEGKSGISNNVADPSFTSTVSYPTLTYDYTRYKLDFYHTQNGEKTSYDVKFDKKSESLIIDSTNNVFDSNNVMTAYTTGDNTNLVTLVFTEIGFYQFDFEYIYIFTSMTGVNPSMDHLTIESKKLMIHGVDLNYSKQGVESAEFRKLQFSANQTAAVDLVVMNGVTEDNQDTLKNQNLGVLYSVDNTRHKLSTEKDVRVGEVILKPSTVKDRTEDTLQNNALVGATKNSQELASYILDISDADYEENIATATNSMLNSISYINTNQGSIWISANETVNKIEDSTTEEITVFGGTPATDHKYKVVKSGSFYFYSKTQFDTNSFSKEIEDGSEISTARVYNNQTIFNDVGYYLVFIKIRADKLQPSTNDYYQVYAFKYTSDTIDITVKTADASETIVGAGGYTKQNVKISWVEPETFESKINAFFYQQMVTDNTAPMSRDELLTLKPYEIQNGTTVLGENVSNGAYSKYLIKLERAGKSATYKAFTIDRQNISGVVAQLVSQTISYGTKYYSYAINSDNNKIIINNGITDSFATMFWNEKISGAEISATYSFTPFIKNDVDNKLVSTQEGERWIQTDYKLGVTQTGYVYSKNTEITDVGAYSVLNDQGIYIFTIEDEAGNGCKYVLIIDKTEGFIQITNLEDNSDVEYLSGSYKLYGNSVKYDVGTHKTIELTQQLGKENEELTALLESNISNFKYGDYRIFNNGTYLSNLSSLFKYLNSNRYLAVKNTKVYIYDRDMEISNSSVTTGRIENSNKGSSLLRTIYVASENNKFSTVYKNPTDSKTWANIEVNLDNSRGMIYYGNTNFDVAGVDPFADLGSDNSGVLQRLFHSADITNTNGAKDKYFAFTFLFGNAPYSVETIKYSYYKLDLNTFDSTVDSASHTQTYFYTLENGDVVVYDKNNKDLEINKTTDGTRGFYMFLTNHHDNTTKEGLYCVTRTYEGEAGTDYGNDLKTVNYYFIVDRNGIIDVTNQIGTEIKINLLEDETKISGTDFTLVSSTPKSLSYNSVNEDYFTYLKTNKLPAVLSIPYSKYLNDGNSSKGYYAGRLKVSVYYKDVYSQISESNKPYLIYNGIVPQDEYKTSNEFFAIDIYNYLKNTDKRLADRICVSEENQNWICLKGEYVVVIEDNIQTTANVKTKKVIGFEINREEYPEVDVNLGFKTTELGESEQSGLAGNYKIVTNKEYVQVILPKYYGTSKTAKVDDSYIYLKETFNGSVKFEGAYNYAGNLNGSDSNGWKSELTEDAAGNRVLLLKTRLTDESGNIIVENLDKPLVYTIKIRYRIGDDISTSNKYENCYYYYDSAVSETRVNYAYSTYTITIDRLAPTENVDELIKDDELIKNGFVDGDLFETACYNPSLYYFTYQYKNYDYHNKNTLQNIYAFKVNSDTEIKGKDANGDLNKIFVKKVETDISDLTLTLPVLDLSSLGEGINVKENEGILTYGDIFDSVGIYEVYEVDLAENITHYVVIYNDAEPEFKINFKYSPAEGGEVTNGHIGTKQYSVYNVLGSSDEKDEDYLLKIDSIENLNDYFFNITVRSNISTWEPVSINTNFKDLKTDTFKNLFDKMNKYFGEFEVKITDRTGTTYTSIIHRYDKDNMKSLNVENLIVKRENGTYYIDLDRANYFDDGIFYYAKTVKVIVRDGMDYKETVYVSEVKDGRYVYYIQGLPSREYVENVDCLKNTTYKIMITDVFGNVSAITFNTSGKSYYALVPDQGFEYSTGIDGTIYSASNLSLEHDTIFTLSDSEIVVFVDNVSIKRDRFNEYFTTRISGDGKVGYIDLVAKQGKLGEVVKYHFQFRDNDLEIDRAFDIVIDTKTNPISFTEISGKSREYNFYQNKDISNIDNLNQYIAENSVDKIMNLAWEVETREYFSYKYELYQKMKDGTIELIETTNMNSIELVTKGDASGAYWFVISVLDKNGKLVGNKIYAFDVQPSNNKLVYVSKDNIAIERTTVFLKNELDGLTLKNEANEVLNCTKDRIDLYISNEELIVKKTRENIELIPYSTILKSTDAGDWVLTVWEVVTTTHKDYLAIMQVPKTEMLVGKVYANVIGLLSTTGHELNKEQSTVYANVDDEIAITAQKLYTFDLNDPADRFASKNAIYIEVAYEIGDEQSIIGNTIFDSEDATSGKYLITGNGNYKFTFIDIAGNIHKFTPEGRDFVNVYALREVVLTLNGKTPIENGYYNKQVELDVYASARFETASIKITAYRNNKEISVPQTLPCVISSFGNFKITVSAKFKTDDNKVHDVSKTVNFVIINENEAKTTMDLSNFSNYEIIKVLNPMLEDVTSVFMREIVNKNQAGLMIAYSSIMENAETFGVTSGKLKFVITFKISDGIYPEFEHDVAFTLNNEIPKINCSLEPGETTKKGFEITFNPSIIYEQVGEAYITINDVVVYSIAGNPVNDLVSLTKSFKQDGDGDYYVKLVTASGTVLQSFKVEIKEPLNASAIIVIIVVVGVVLGITITIIVLRRKMRIR